jgi:hypothetical protein
VASSLVALARLVQRMLAPREPAPEMPGSRRGRAGVDAGPEERERIACSDRAAGVALVSRANQEAAMRSLDVDGIGEALRRARVRALGALAVACAIGAAGCIGAADGEATAEARSALGALGDACTEDTDCDSNACFDGLCSCGGDHLVISEVRSRGSFGGMDEFIELYNPTASAVTLDSTWKITGKSHNNIMYTVRWTGTGNSIPAHGHFLIVGDSYTLGPAGDDPLTIGITDAASLVLTHGGATVDALCYAFNSTTTTALQGAGFTCEGTPFSSNPHDNTTSTNHDLSVERYPGGASGNCGDTGDSSADFFVSSPANPQSSTSPITL